MYLLLILDPKPSEHGNVMNFSVPQEYLNMPSICSKTTTVVEITGAQNFIRGYLHGK
jgi:hypothetical protein